MRTSKDKTSKPTLAEFIKYPVWGCLRPILTFAVIALLFLYAIYSFTQPKTNSRSERIDRLVTNAQQLIFETERFDSEDWKIVVPQIKLLASEVASDATLVQDANHWYKDWWAWIAIMFGIALMSAVKKKEN
jgi:hypothetical protein